MSSAAIRFRSDAQCVRVNTFVRFFFSLCLSVFWFTSPHHFLLKILNIFSLPPWLAASRRLPLPLPHFLYPLLFPFPLSLYTPLPPYFHQPILFTPPVILIKLKRNSVRSWVFAHSTRTAKLLVPFKANLICPCVIPVLFHCQFNNASLPWTFLDWHAASDNGMFLVPRKNALIDCRVEHDSCYKQMT